MPLESELSVMQSVPSTVRPALLRIAGVTAAEAARARITSLKGLSNLTFRVELSNRNLVVRLARPGIGSYANRADEIAACRLAMRIGIGPDLILADAGSGLLVSDYVAGATPGLLPLAPSLLQRMGRALGSLHRCRESLPGRYDVFAVITRYEAMLAAAGTALPGWPAEVAVQRSNVEAALARAARPLVPCHNDPVPANFLDLGDRAMLVDWEYAGMNDPAFDLAYLSLEAELTAEGDSALLAAHGEAGSLAPLLPPYKFLICVMSALWSRLHPPGAGWEAWGARREAMATAMAHLELR